MKPPTKIRRDTTRPPTSLGERVPDFERERDRIDRDLARRIAAWAKSYERCPLAGCRRNSRCLKPDNCRAVSREPVTEEQRIEIRRHIDALVEADGASREGPGSGPQLSSPARPAKPATVGTHPRSPLARAVKPA